MKATVALGVFKRDQGLPPSKHVVYNQYNSPGVEVRFWEKVDRTLWCWEWTANLGIGGRYGSFKLDGRDQPAHRVAYELTYGPIPDGLEIDHLCRNTRCVRPDHLETVTHRENMRRGMGWAGENARKTVCGRHGNPLVVVTKGGRGCRECRREDNRLYRRRLRERLSA